MPNVGGVGSKEAAAASAKKRKRKAPAKATLERRAREARKKAAENDGGASAVSEIKLVYWCRSSCRRPARDCDIAKLMHNLAIVNAIS